jgi:hypothetical protein
VLSWAAKVAPGTTPLPWVSTTLSRSKPGALVGYFSACL